MSEIIENPTAFCGKYWPRGETGNQFLRKEAFGRSFEGGDAGIKSEIYRDAFYFM